MFEQTSHVTNAISSSTNENNEIYFLEAEIDDTCEIVYDIIDNSFSDVNKTARKLHLIFGHPSADTLNKTIKLGLKGRDQTMVKSLSSAIEEYSKSCARCSELAPHKPKPKVCFVATKFNDVVAFDITFWNDPLARKTFMILHFIDLATILSAAVVVHSKESTHIVGTLVTTLIDNIFSNNIIDETKSGNILLTLSEHFSQFVSVRRERPEYSNFSMITQSSILKNLEMMYQYKHGKLI